MERIGDVDMIDKFMASFDVKSLFTNVSVEVALEVKALRQEERHVGNYCSSDFRIIGFV